MTHMFSSITRQVAHCYFCNAECTGNKIDDAEDTDYCMGCNKFICADCDVNPLLRIDPIAIEGHKPEDHLGSR